MSVTHAHADTIANKWEIAINQDNCGERHRMTHNSSRFWHMRYPVSSFLLEVLFILLVYNIVARYFFRNENIFFAIYVWYPFTNAFYAIIQRYEGSASVKTCSTRICAEECYVYTIAKIKQFEREMRCIRADCRSCMISRKKEEISDDGTPCTFDGWWKADVKH